MTNAASLWVACFDQPADDTLRLLFAEQVRASDARDQQAGGRFLWAGVTAAGFRDTDPIDDAVFYTAQAHPCDASSKSGEWVLGSARGAPPEGNPRSSVPLNPMYAVPSRCIL